MRTEGVPLSNWPDDVSGLILQATLFEDIFFRKAISELLPTLTILLQTQEGIEKLVVCPDDPTRALELCSDLIEGLYRNEEFLGVVMSQEARWNVEENYRDIFLQLLYLRGYGFYQARMVPIQRDGKELPKRTGRTIILKPDEFEVTEQMPLIGAPKWNCRRW